MANRYPFNPKPVDHFTQVNETQINAGKRDYSEFLPEINRTESMQRFFGSTVNQLLSSGSTMSLDTYWGRVSGRTYNAEHESYAIESTSDRLNYQFVPGVVARENDSVTESVSYVNWLRRFRQVGGADSNHDRAFAEPGYTLDVPIDIDMFINYANYYWLEGNMPVAVIEPTSIAPIDIDSIVGLGSYTTPVLANNKTLTLVNGMRISFSGANATSTSGNYAVDAIYYVENIGGPGGIVLVESVNAAGVETFSSLTPYSILYPRGWDLDPWDTRPWDERGFFEDYAEETTFTREDISLNKSYIVMQRSSLDANPWARTNRWFSGDAIKATAEFNDFEALPYLNRRTRGQRPILEFRGNIELFNSGKNYTGPVDHIVTEFQYQDIETNGLREVNNSGIQDGDIILVGSEFGVSTVYGNSYIVNISDLNVVTWTPHNTNYANDDYVLVRNGTTRGLVYKFNGVAWELAQNKLERTTQPLFNLYTDQLTEIASLSSNDFAGSTIFEYSVDDDAAFDRELGINAVKRDGVVLDDFQFNWTLNNQRYFRDVTLNTSTEILGYYNWHDWSLNEYFNGWSNLRESQRVPIVQTLISDGITQPEFDLGTTTTHRPTEWTMQWDGAGYHWFSHGLTGLVDIGRSNPVQIWRLDTDYTIHLSIGNTAGNVEWVDPTGAVNPDINITTVGDTVTLNVNSAYDYDYLQYRSIADNSIVGEIWMNSANQRRVVVRRNGQRLIEGNDYVISGTTLTVNAIGNDNDVYDLQYVSDTDVDRAVYDVAPVHIYNTTNEPFMSAGYSDLFTHFESQLIALPGFDGSVAGDNNYKRIRRIHNFGGTIRQQFIETPKLQYLIDQPDQSPIRALRTISNDYEQFKQFFRTKTRQLWETRGFENVRDLVDAALLEINIGKNSNFRYANSDMAYYNTTNELQYIITDANTVFDLPNVRNTYGDTRNHIQVWLREYDGTSKFVERQLREGDEYAIEGPSLSLMSAANFNTSSARLTIRWYDHKHNSYIPFSAVKLGFFRPTRPEIINGVLIGHDGSRWNTTGTEFNDVDSVNFDPVTAALLDYELRVYNNLSPLHYTQPDMMELQPNANRTLSYTRDDMNVRLDDWFNRWASRNDVFELDGDIYNVADNFTWNYSTVADAGASWRAVYQYYFGTDRPHTHPWEMLGHRTKPSWWDTHYAWTPGPLRVALLNALEHGIVGNPNASYEVDINYARSNYDWSQTTIIVSNTGTLNDPVTAGVVSAPTAFDAAIPVVFGDWGEVENRWRTTSEYLFALAEVYLQLKPFSTHEIWWSLNRWTVNNTVTERQWIDNDTCRRASLNELHNQVVTDGIVSMIRVVRGGTGYNSASIDFATGSNCVSAASGEVYVAGGEVVGIEITNPGRGYVSSPSDSVLTGNANAMGAQIEFELDFNYSVTHLGFVSLPSETHGQFINDTTTLSDVISQLSVEHIIHVGGFTDTNIIDLELDGSYANGKTPIPNTQYDIVLDTMPRGDAVFFSGVKITWLDGEGFRVEGYDNDTRRFLITPVSTSGSNEAVIVGDTTVIGYRKFHNEVVSVTYGTIFKRRQALFDFLQGLGNYYRTIGFQVPNWQNIAREAIEWSLERSNEPFYLSGYRDTLTFEHGSHGEVAPVHDRYIGGPAVLDLSKRRIDTNNLLVLRNENETELSTIDGTAIMGIELSTVEHEHVIVLRNTSPLDTRAYDPTTGIYQRRIRLVGERTRNWRGRVDAPGYLVNDTGITLNMESSVREIEHDWINPETKTLNRLTRQTMGFNVGYMKPTYLVDTHINDNAAYSWHKGERKTRGTAASIKAMGRNKNIFGEEFKTELYEEWMVRQGEYGDISESRPVEFAINPDNVKGNNQMYRFNDTFVPDNASDLIVDLHANGPDAIRGDFNEPFGTYPFVPRDTTSLALIQQTEEFNKSAGLPLVTEIDYFVRNIDDINDVYNINEPWALVPNWQNIVAYQEGDIVRRDGKVWRLLINSTGLTPSDADILVRATQVFPSVANGTTFIANGTTVTFSKFATETTTDEIRITGSVTNPSMPSGSTLQLDNVNVNFIKTETVVTWSDIVLDGSITAPTIRNDANKEFVIQYANNNSDTLTDIVIPFNETLGSETMLKIWIDALTGFSTSPSFDALTRLNTLEAFRTAYIAATSVSAWETWLNGYHGTDVALDAMVNPEHIANTINGTPGAPWETEATALIQNDLDLMATVSGNISTESPASLISGTLNDATAFGNDLTTTNNALLNDPDIDEFVAYVVADGTRAFNPNTSIAITNQTPVQYVTDNLNSILNKINTAITNAGVSDIAATSFNNGSGNVVRITRTNTDQAYRLVIGSGTANIDLGFENNLEGTLSSTQTVEPRNMALTEIATTINSSAIANVGAQIQNNRLVLVSTNSSLLIGDTQAATILGITPGLSTATSSSATDEIDLNILDVVEQINNAAIPDLIVSAVDGVLVLNSTAESLIIGSGTANTSLGLSEGTRTSENFQVTENTFNSNDWEEIDDPADFAVWVINNIGSNSRVQARTNDYDVYRTIDLDLGIYEVCTGSEYGEDALVKTIRPHRLSAGDYVVITNSNSIPSVDGVHRVVQVRNDTMFLIDRFIEQKGFVGKVLPLRSVKFTDFNSANAMGSDTRYYDAGTDTGITNGSLVYVERDIDSSGALQDHGATYRVVRNADGIGLIKVREENAKTRNDQLQNGVLYSYASQQSISTYEVFDPLKGVIAGSASSEIDIRSETDPAIYNNTTDASHRTSEGDRWTGLQMNTVWWDLSNAIYIDYEQGDDEYQRNYWGALFPGASIDIYEWTRSPVAPDEYEQAVRTGLIVDGVPLTGAPYSRVDTIGDIQYYWVEELEVNVNTNQLETVYYFWVRNKTTVAGPDREFSVRQLEQIVQDPTAVDIDWIAAVGTNKVIISNLDQYLDNADLVMQINIDKNDVDYHQEFLLLAENDPETRIPDWLHVSLRDSLAGFAQPSRLDNVIPYYSTVTYYIDNVVIGADNNHYVAHAEVTGVEPSTDLANDFWRRIETGRKNRSDVWNDWDTVEYILPRNIPDLTLHPFARQGIQVRPAQTWFIDIENARRSVIDKLNSQLIEFNLLDSDIDWTRAFDSTITIGNQTINISDYWDFADWFRQGTTFDRSIVNNVVTTDDARDALVAFEGQTVLVTTSNYPDRILREAGYMFTDGVWQLEYKQKATIQFTPNIWSSEINQSGWDTAAWDVVEWDRDSRWVIVDIFDKLYTELWVDQRAYLYTDLWFHMANFVLAEQNEVDWLVKSSYFKVRHETALEKDYSKFFREEYQAFDDYITSVKPFRSKLRQNTSVKASTDNANLAFADTAEIRVQTNPLNGNIDNVNTRSFRLTTNVNGEQASSIINNANKSLTIEDVSADATTITIMNDITGTSITGTSGVIWINGERIEYTDVVTNAGTTTIVQEPSSEFGPGFSSAFTPPPVSTVFGSTILIGCIRGTNGTLARTHDRLSVVEQEFALTQNADLSDWGNSIEPAWQDLGRSLVDPSNTDANGVTINAAGLGTVNMHGSLLDRFNIAKDAS